MTHPYTQQPLDALMAAQTSVGMVLMAVLLLRPLRPRVANLLLAAAIWACILSPVDQDFLRGLGFTVGPLHMLHLFKVSAALATLAVLLTRRPWLIVMAVAGEAALWFLTNYIQGSDWGLAAAHVAFFGALLGAHWHAFDRPAASWGASPPSVRAYWVDDAVLASVATLAGALVSTVVLHRYTNSGDEWADTYQAAVFAKLRAYATAPRCASAFQSFWVFEHMGREFAQYTPGWPLFMAPFVAVRMAWLAGPASLGLLVAGSARLARRAASGFAPGTLPPHASLVRAAGWFGAIAMMLASTLLINGGSRYPHVFVAATFAWSVEALCEMATPGIARARQWGCGVVLGTSAALMLSARPGDGATLGVGLAVYCLYAIVRRRVGWRALAAATLAFAFWGGLTLVILHAQLGKWFQTGYSLTAALHPWANVTFSVPRPNEYTRVVPLETGSYCWWPLSPALGLAGLAALRGRARRLAPIFFFSCVPFLTFYAMAELGRSFDLGYGPRYQLPCVVPMAAGTGAVLATLWDTAKRRVHAGTALRAGGPAALAIASMVVGVVRIAPLVYPYNYADVKTHNRFHDALKIHPVHNAIVFAGGGLINTDPMDLTENLPLDLYPNQDVLVALDRSPDLVACVKELYPTRRYYRAVPGNDVTIVPY